MYKHSKRTGYCFTVEDGEAAITILKPKSGELKDVGQYLVLYEDAHGNVDLHLLKLDEIASTYLLDLRDLEDIV
jgi:hypothetical protein